MTRTFYDETAFFDAWKTGVTIAGPRYFGDGTYSPTTARSKWDLEPRLDDITENLGVLRGAAAV